MSFEQPDNPFFLSFTDVLTCVLGGSVALFLIFVVMVKIVPAREATEAADTLIGRSGLTVALERQKLGGKSPITVQFVSPDCAAMRAIKTDVVGIESWDFTERDVNQRPLCGKLLLLGDGLPDGTTRVGAPILPIQPVRVTVSIGAYTWSPMVSIDASIWSSWGSDIVRLNPSKPENFIRFANETFRGRPFDGNDQL